MNTFPGKPLSAFLILLACVFAVACSDGGKTTSSEVAPSELINVPETSKSTPDESEKEDRGVPELSFEAVEHNFGKVYEGETVDHTFTFTNTGTGPLLIQNARASCGCTVPSWPKEAIAPGEKGEIQVRFNTTGKLGNQRKTVTLTANTQPNILTLIIQGEVVQGAPMDGPLRN